MSEEVTIIRKDVTWFETCVAGGVGLFTGGPIGALAAGASLRGLQGKWVVWALLGIPGTIVVNALNLSLGLSGAGLMSNYSSSVSTASPVVSEVSTPRRDNTAFASLSDVNREMAINYENVRTLWQGLPFVITGEVVSHTHSYVDISDGDKSTPDMRCYWRDRSIKDIKVGESVSVKGVMNIGNGFRMYHCQTHN